VAAPRSFLQGVVGVFGFPVAENPTQAMVEPAFADMGLDWRYLTIEVPPDRLGDAVRGAKAMGWRGFNCTIPHKVAVIPHLDRLSPAAETIGAVNCVVRRDELWIGDNTDGKGFLQSVAARPADRGLKAVVLGAGGAARAIATELALAGAVRLTIVNRSPGRGQALADLIRQRTGGPRDLRRLGRRVSRPPRHRPAGQRHRDRPVPRRRGARPARRLDPPGRHDRLRRHPQPAPHPPHPGRGSPGLHRARRPGHARQSGHHRYPALDRSATPGPR
jgi:hypothetical protein